MKILVIHGPNLQLLGTRQPAIYGTANLHTINNDLKRLATQRGVILSIVQSNHEGQIVEQIGNARGRYDAMIINPAAYTHTSVAIRDAIEASALPAVEVHLSNIYAREPFRQHSLIAPVCRGQVCGFGAVSYRLALEAAVALVQAAPSPAPEPRRIPAAPPRRRTASRKRSRR
jgi:3-dehydroquinate dehydratase-2